MFKVGDDVISKVNVHGYPDLAIKVHKVTFIDHGIVVINNEFYFKHDELQHATSEEITAGHRIDKSPLMQHLDKCEEEVKKWPKWKLQSVRDAFGIPVLDNDMGDDSHIENHISKNCKVIDYD